MTLPTLTPDMARMAQIECMTARISHELPPSRDQLTRRFAAWCDLWQALAEYSRKLSGLTGYTP